MVSIGTVLTLGIVAAVGIIGYGLYRNSAAVGSALSRGTQTNVIDPLGNYFNNLFGGSTNGKAPTKSSAPLPTPLDPREPAFGFLPEAVAQLPTGDTAISLAEATELSNKYLPKAKAGAELILKSFAVSSQEDLITTATQIAKQSPTPALTQAYSIIEQARVSVGGVEPLTNKFYQLFTLANKPYGEAGKVLPLSKEAVQYYGGLGIVAREVYL